MTTPPRPRPKSAFQLDHPPSNVNDGDSELHRQQELKKKLARTSKSSFDWLWQKSGILGNWMNKQAGKMGMEAFWPTSLDKECDKCARILYTFTQRGLDGTIHSTLDDPYASGKTQKIFKKIPAHIIQNAEGLAIFTVFRSGLGWSAASGSGIVIARDSPTTWGAPSGILIHTIGVGFLAGIDVYDAVLVLRTQKAVAAFAKPKVSLGAELAVVAGPIGNGVSFESGPELSPVFSYTKSKGIYGGLQLDGNIIIERTDENARFYGRKVKAEQILQGGAVAVPRAASGLIAVIDAAEGKAFDPEDLPAQIDVSPSEESTGVSTISESRSRAAAEHGIPEEADEESSNTSLTPDQDFMLRRRTLPPMPFYPDGSSSIDQTEEGEETSNAEASVEPAKKIDDSSFERPKEESDHSVEVGREEPDGSLELSKEEPDRNVERATAEEPTVVQPSKHSLAPPPPPPPPRRRVVPPLPTRELSNDTLPIPTATKQNRSSMDSASSPIVPSSADSVSLLDHSDKPPEPFQLHERSASNDSTSSPTV